MQLIFETDNINISNKMTTLEQKPRETIVSNGDVKEVDEEAIIKSENGMTSKGIENKENMTANTEDSSDTNTAQPANENASPEKAEERDSEACDNNLTEEISANSKEQINENSEIKTMKNGETKEDEKLEIDEESKAEAGDEQPKSDIKLKENGVAESPVVSNVTNSILDSESINESQMEVEEAKKYEEDVKELDSREETNKTQNKIVKETSATSDEKENLQYSRNMEVPEMEIDEDKELCEDKNKKVSDESPVTINETSKLQNSDDLKASQMEIDINKDIVEESNVSKIQETASKIQNEASEPMEVDSRRIGQNLEEQVTESLSALVSEIVDNLDEPDIADGFESDTDSKDLNKETFSEAISPPEQDAEKTESAELGDAIQQDDEHNNQPKCIDEEKVDGSDQQKKISVQRTTVRKPEQITLSGTDDDKDNEALQICVKNNAETGVSVSNEENELKESYIPDDSNSADASTADKNTQNKVVISSGSKDDAEKETSDNLESSEKVSILSNEENTLDSVVNKDKESSVHIEKEVLVDSGCEENSTANKNNEQDISNENKLKNENSENSAFKKAVAEENTKVKERISADIEEINLLEDNEASSQLQSQKIDQTTTELVGESKCAPVIKLSNTMDILSDDEDEGPKKPTETPKESNSSINRTEPEDKQCINLDDDDDVMVIDEDTTKDDKKNEPGVHSPVEQVNESKSENKVVELDSSKEDGESKQSEAVIETSSPKPEIDSKDVPQVKEKKTEVVQEKPKPLVPDDFFKTYRKNLADMTRDDLEEFCILKIVESIIDRSSLNEIRSKIKIMGQTVEEYKKKASMLAKQNRDLQVVLKSVQEEQKKQGNQSITPLKIMRSVGMQVLMTDKVRKRPGPASMNTSGNSANLTNNTNTMNNRQQRNMNQSPRGTPQKQANNSPIPVPRLVPAAQNINNRVSLAGPPPTNTAKNNHAQNVAKMTSPSQKAPEKRPHARVQSVTVDLTDDEPPLKVPAKNSPAPPVRVVSTQNLLAHQRPALSPAVNSPRKVYIPININAPPGQNIRPGGPRARGPAPLPTIRPKQSNLPIKRVQASRHPAPLPDAMKQYQPPNWKALPPAPDLKLSKVENGIVISWKIEGYQEDSYEEIASYQLYAYQETSAPPSTALWKKIGDVKALPLPMACTLTQFMAGYKYYFAVRAVDIRSRLGPFSLPGSILLLNKM